jgi:hypothetical protein
MKSEPTQASVNRVKRAAASLVLLALLVQISLFFVGLMDPVQRTASLWGKTLEERRAVVWQLGAVLTSVAERFPEDSRIYLMYPDSSLHPNAVYYFYPRLISISMTNGVYGSNEQYKNWHELPTENWLLSNKFNYVLTFKGGGRAWEVRLGIGAALAAAEKTLDAH